MMTEQHEKDFSWNDQEINRESCLNHILPESKHDSTVVLLFVILFFSADFFFKKSRAIDSILRLPVVSLNEQTQVSSQSYEWGLQNKVRTREELRAVRTTFFSSGPESWMSIKSHDKIIIKFFTPVSGESVIIITYWRLSTFYASENGSLTVCRVICSDQMVTFVFHSSLSLSRKK